MHDNRQNYAKRSSNTDSVLGRNLPANLQAEKSILGALLLTDENLSHVTELLSPDDFYLPSHKIIYQAIIDVSNQYGRIDIISLQDDLTKKSLLNEVGGTVYLIELQEDIPAIGMIAQHAQIIKEKAVLRELINSAASIITNCYDQDNKAIDQILDDRMTSGFQKGDLIVLAARPSMGKTALALGFALQAAREGNSVGFFSLEMAAEQLTLRLLSAESQVAHHNIRNATITSDEWIELTNVAAGLAELPLFIDDTAMLNIMELRAKARKLKAEKKLDFIVIDYLQLLYSTRRHENRHQEVSEISRSLKALAKELEVPVVALSQLSRAVDSRMDKRPMLSDLRESGAIEQDADLIMFLYRDIVYNPDTEYPALSELIVGKQRNGPTGKVYLNFLKEITIFEESEDGPFEP